MAPSAETPGTFPPIEVNDYGRNFKSIPYTTPEGDRGTTAVMNPGEVFTFDVTEKEMVKVEQGTLRATLPGCSPANYTAGTTLVIPANSKGVMLEAIGAVQVKYDCRYIKDEAAVAAVPEADASEPVDASAGKAALAAIGQGVPEDARAEAIRVLATGGEGVSQQMGIDEAFRVLRDNAPPAAPRGWTSDTE
jgi:uncharacterized protein YaiE (UPF0345 family)